MKKKSSDGVHWKRGEDRRLLFYWRIGTEKSKDYLDHEQCAMDYVTKYLERFPKYKELVYDKTWDQIFKIFGISISERR
jgi:hypothetical protein